MLIKSNPSEYLNSAMQMTSQSGLNVMQQSVLGGTGNDIFMTSLGGSPQVISRTDFSPGTLMDTGNPLDVSTAPGEFIVVNNATDGLVLVRTGSFTTNNQGVLIDQNQNTLMGLTTNAQGQVTQSPSLSNLAPVTVSTTSIANASSAIELTAALNFNAPSVIGAASTLAGTEWSTVLSQTNSQFTATTTAYNSLGQAVTIQLTFTNCSVLANAQPLANASNQWSLQVSNGPLGTGSNNATVPSQSFVNTIQQGNSGNNYFMGSTDTFSAATQMMLTFDQNGNLQSSVQVPPVTITFNNGAAPLTLSLNLNVTSVAAPQAAPTVAPPAGQQAPAQPTFTAQQSTLESIEANGCPLAQFQEVLINQNGLVQARYSSGSQNIVVNVAQLYTASTADPTILAAAIAGNGYVPGPAFSNITLSTPNVGGVAPLIIGSLQQSNVNIQQAMMNQITNQQVVDSSRYVTFSFFRSLEKLITAADSTR